MARRRRGRDVHGWLVLDKPVGLSSAQAVNRVQRVFDARKAGHGGTLDPAAEGILPIALGEATKTVGYVMDGAKDYVFRVRWGEARATDDAEGEVTATSDIRPDEAGIRAVLPRFIGEISQVPPAYSAIKLNGQRAYALARKGETPTMTARTVRVDALELVRIVDDDRAEFRVFCGKGTYVRSLARDLAQALGTLGYVEYLRRCATAGFSEKHAISLEMLETFRHSAAAFEHLLPVETALDDILALAVTGDEADRVICGQSLQVPDITTAAGRDTLSEGRVLKLMCDDRLIAIAEIREGRVRPVRVMNYTQHANPER